MLYVTYCVYVIGFCEFATLLYFFFHPRRVKSLLSYDFLPLVLHWAGSLFVFGIPAPSSMICSKKISTLKNFCVLLKTTNECERELGLHVYIPERKGRVLESGPISLLVVASSLVSLVLEYGVHCFLHSQSMFMECKMCASCIPRFQL